MHHARHEEIPEKEVAQEAHGGEQALLAQEAIKRHATAHDDDTHDGNTRDKPLTHQTRVRRNLRRRHSPCHACWQKIAVHPYSKLFNAFKHVSLLSFRNHHSALREESAQDLGCDFRSRVDSWDQAPHTASSAETQKDWTKNAKGTSYAFHCFEDVFPVRRNTARTGRPENKQTSCATSRSHRFFRSGVYANPPEPTRGRMILGNAPCQKKKHRRTPSKESGRPPHHQRAPPKATGAWLLRTRGESPREVPKAETNNCEAHNPVLGWSRGHNWPRSQAKHSA